MEREGGRWIAKLPCPVGRRLERSIRPRGLSLHLQLTRQRDSVWPCASVSPLVVSYYRVLTYIHTCILNWDVESQNDDQIVFAELVSLQSQHSLTLRRFQEVLSCKGVRLHLWTEGQKEQNTEMGFHWPVTAWHWPSLNSEPPVIDRSSHFVTGWSSAGDCFWVGFSASFFI